MNTLIDSWWRLIEKIFSGTLRFLEETCKISISENSEQVLLQFIKFGIIGVSNSLVNYLAYLLSLLLFRKFTLFATLDFMIAQMVAFVLSVLWSYYWNNKYVFCSNSDGKHFAWLPTLVKTFVSYSFTGLILSELLLLFWIHIVGLSEFVAPIINILICMPINFVLNKLWAFKK